MARACRRPVRSLVRRRPGAAPVRSPRRRSCRRRRRIGRCSAGEGREGRQARDAGARRRAGRRSRGGALAWRAVRQEVRRPAGDGFWRRSREGVVRVRGFCDVAAAGHAHFLRAGAAPVNVRCPPMNRRLIVLLLVLGAGGAVTIRAIAAQRGARVIAPAFEVDPLWPKPLPNHWVVGSVIGVSVDSRDHVWIVHRPGSLNAKELYRDQKPQAGECCSAAPPVLEFDQAGNLVGHWGGPGPGYQWPESNHGIFVDYKDNVWSGGNGAPDAQILKFTRDGRFLMQSGRSGVHRAPAAVNEQPTFGGNSTDTMNFGRAAKI